MLILVMSHASRSLPGWDEAMSILRSAGHEIVDPGPTRAWDGDLSVLAKAEVLLAGLGPVDRAVLEAAPRLRLIAKPGVGVDNIDLHAATELGIVVCNTSGSNTECVADHTIGLMLAVVRQLVELDSRTRAGRGWSDVSVAPGQLSGRRLAVIGTGNIGRAVAKRAVRGFGMVVTAYSRRPDEAFARELGVTYRPFPDVLRDANVVSIHVPLDRTTFRLIRAKELALMLPSAIIVNTARGGIVDESALSDALRRGRLAGAGFDVFETEPCFHSPLFDAPNTVLTPHVAGRSGESAHRGRLMTAENILAALAGRPVRVVNREVLERADCRIELRPLRPGHGSG